MKAAVFHAAHDVRIEEVVDPSPPRADELVLKVTRAAICGTDAAEWDHGPVLCRPGVVLGHEFVGRVVDVGPEVTGYRVGDRVVSGAGISCGRCHWCLRSRTNLCAEYRTLGLQVDGGLAEYVTSPAGICHLVPDSCDDDAAVMTQPLAVALHALSRVAQRPEESVAVIGVGGIGAFIVAGAGRRAVDGRVVAIDIDAERLSTASALGADEVFDATGHELAALLQELTEGVGFDVVIEASGAAHAPAAATVGVRRGGRVLLLGLHAAPRELDLTRMIVREVDVVTSVAHICDSDIPAALEVLADSDVAAVTAGPTIPLDALVDEGLRPLVEGRAGGKILIAPNGEPEVTPLEPGTVAGVT
ncbi:MAG TPA: alcohol dehydrogenase catalytic domain-containing protein [Gaiella sp.]|nr:alcohol dehydrogenase catalytic domain-containing protein [Gaiella sp.]